jgi:predicted transcriptional regulator
MNDNTAPAETGEFDLVELSADIVSAYVSHNAVSRV